MMGRRSVCIWYERAILCQGACTTGTVNPDQRAGDPIRKAIAYRGTEVGSGFPQWVVEERHASAWQ